MSEQNTNIPKITFHVPCPHCGFENCIRREITSVIMPLEEVFCDIEAGGCDKTFGARLMVCPQARTYKITDEKILGDVMMPKAKKDLNV